MSSPSNMGPSSNQVANVNEFASINALVAAGNPSRMNSLAGVTFNLLLSTVKTIRGIFQAIVFLLLLPIAITIISTSYIKHKERAWIIFATIVAAYSISILIASRRILLLILQIFRSMTGIYVYHQKYIMTLLNLDHTNPFTTGCYRKRGGLSDPHPETLSFQGFLRYQGCMGRQDGAYDQDERYLMLLKLIVVGLSICILCLLLPLLTRLVGFITIPDERFMSKKHLANHHNDIDEAYQKGLHAGRNLMEKMVHSLEAELENIRDRIAMCTKYHKKEHVLALQLTGLEKQIEIEKELLARKSFDYDRLLKEYAAMAGAYESISISEPARLLQKIVDKDIEILKLENRIQELKNSDSAKELRDAEQRWSVKMAEEEKRHRQVVSCFEERLAELDGALRAEKDLNKGTLAQAKLDKKLADASFQNALGEVNNLQAIASRQLATIHQHEEAMVSARAEAMRLLEDFQSEAASKQALVDKVLELENKIVGLKNTVEAQVKEINAGSEERSKLWDRHKESLQGWQKERKELRAANEKLSKELKTMESSSSEALERQAGRNAVLNEECFKLADQKTHYQKLANENLSMITSLSKENEALKVEIAKLKIATTIPIPTSTVTTTTSAMTPASPSGAATPPTTQVQAAKGDQTTIGNQVKPEVVPTAAASRAAAEQQYVDEQLAFMKSLSFDDA